jgi:hypothetical protein
MEHTECKRQPFSPFQQCISQQSIDHCCFMRDGPNDQITESRLIKVNTSNTGQFPLYFCQQQATVQGPGKHCPFITRFITLAVVVQHQDSASAPPSRAGQQLHNAGHIRGCGRPYPECLGNLGGHR